MLLVLLVLLVLIRLMLLSQCPLDPSHSVYVRMLPAHLKKCNRGRRDAALEAEPYYSLNANSGPETHAAGAAHGAGAPPLTAR